MRVYKSKRSGRVYGEPVVVDGVILAEVVWADPFDPIKAGEIIPWDTFPKVWMVLLDGEAAKDALQGK